MNFIFKQKDFELTDAIKEYAEKRFGEFERYFRDKEDKVITFEFSKTSDHHKQGEYFTTAVHFFSRGKTFHASSSKDDMYKAIDDVKDEVAREFDKGQGRYRALLMSGSRKLKELVKRANPWKD